MSTEYVLGNDLEELLRLKLQHDLWKSELIHLWNKSNLKNSKNILDLGCGPGFTTLDLLNYIDHKCQITAVDISEHFLNYLNSQKVKTEQTLVTHQSFIEKLELPQKNYELQEFVQF